LRYMHVQPILRRHKDSLVKVTGNAKVPLVG